VFPEQESKIVFSGLSIHVRMPSWTIRSAGRSLTDPPGLNPSNLAKIRTLAGSPAGSFLSSSKGV
jgi:hypothetical protein